MRRGLIAWSRAELPEAVFDRRVERARAAMAAANLDALVLYTNNTRPAGVSWFTGFVPYWSEGLLVLLRAGGPQLVVALSKRVQDWLERTSHAAGVTCAPRVGSEAATAALSSSNCARAPIRPRLLWRRRRRLSRTARCRKYRRGI
ncbi:MAG: aminopeptidase P family N-terminal domain-containing protein [Proteobacteria bacterium]|nr:aminopeptidase P family N-terminal domain-containing protein [Pseudomonadota bacterium]